MLKRTIIVILLTIFYGVAGRWDYCEAKYKKHEKGYFDECMKMKEPYRQVCLDVQALKLSWGNER